MYLPQNSMGKAGQDVVFISWQFGGFHQFHGKVIAIATMYAISTGYHPAEGGGISASRNFSLVLHLPIAIHHGLGFLVMYIDVNQVNHH